MPGINDDPDISKLGAKRSRISSKARDSIDGAATLLSDINGVAKIPTAIKFLLDLFF
ncbi:hypothetical protein MAH1_21430 [Sessilibacter sp. MAH1]